VFGSDQGYACNAGTGRCERPRDPCLADVECLPLFSLWFFDCMSDADCFLFSDDVCVAVTGGGKCARLVPEAGCMDSTPDQVLMPRLGTPGSVLVCANESLVCREGSCVPGCRSDLECTPERNGSLCDEQTRTCKCVDDIDCQGQGVSHCDVASGTCQCTRDLDCGDVLDADVCASGRCGCSSAAACQGERRFSGTSYVCE
jgi:hypothetical protein